MNDTTHIPQVAGRVRGIFQYSREFFLKKAIAKDVSEMFLIKIITKTRRLTPMKASKGKKIQH
ncbi:MAG TPA: hypothetical protein DCE56_37290 [Cyanobacteria bacterium UBA8553]|nr:hypothetical protein [Cyanobacteria bacterium UBA8553]